MKKTKTKRFLSVLLALAMVLTMLPMSVFAAAEDGWYWSDDQSVLYIKDGNNIDLYDALLEVYGSTPSKSSFKYDAEDHTYWTWNGTEVSDGSGVDLTHGQKYYAVARNGTATYDNDNKIIFTVKHYYVVTVDIKGADSGSVTYSGNDYTNGKSFEYVKGTSAIVLNKVGGYNTPTASGVGVSPTTSGTLTVTYTAEDTAKYTVSSEVTAGGNVALSPNGEVADGTTVTITATPNANYYVESVTVNGDEYVTADAVIKGSFSATVYTGEVKVEGADVFVVVEFAERKLVLKNLTDGIAVNGYSTTTGGELAVGYKNALVAANFVDYDKSVAVATNDDIDVLMYGSTFVTGDDGVIDVEDLKSYHVGTIVDSVPVSKSFKIVANGNNRYPTVYADNVTVQLTEARQAPTIRLSATEFACCESTADVESKLDTALTIVNSDGESIKADAEYTVTYSPDLSDALGNYSVSIVVTNDGKTWIASTSAYTANITATGHNYNSVVTAPTCTAKGYTTYTCACGDSYVADYVDAAGHNYNSVVTAPTCTEKGYTTYTCACGDSYVADYVDAAGHSYEAVVTKPTCTEAGYTTYTCSECDDSYTADEVEALGHSYTSKVTTEATCTQKGVKTFTCGTCGDTYTEDVAATGHNYEAVVTAPTCTEKGYTTYTCACGDTYTDNETAAKGHTAGEPVTDNASIIGATCGQAGSYQTVVSCTVCGKELERETVTVAATGDHNYVTATERKEASCTEEGYVIEACSCGATQTTKIPATGHSHKAVVTAPTCTEGGYTTHTCANCGDSYTDSTTAATGHNYNPVVTEPTCTDGGYTTYTCANCGDSYVADEVAALGHSYTSVVTAPTCTAQGYTTHTCSVCGDSYVDSYVNSTGHNYEGVVTTAPTCTEKGVKTFTCGNCDDSYTEAVAATGHSHKAVVTAPTCTAQGYTTYTCACGDSYVSDYTAVADHTYNHGTYGECTACDAFKAQSGEITVNGYTKADVKEKVLTAVLGEGYTPDTYTVQIYANYIIGTGYTDYSAIYLDVPGTESFKIVANGDEQIVSVKVNEERDSAEIKLDYTNGTNFNTENQFKAAIEGSIKVNGSAFELKTTTGTVSYAENADGSYNVTIKVYGTENYVETTTTFENVTWTVNKYTLTFLKEDSTEITKLTVPYGTEAADIEGIPAVPAKEADAQYTYTANDWGVQKVTGDATYTASYTETLRSYTISWDTNGDGTADDTTTVEYGTAPSYTAPTMTDAVFAGWRDKDGTLYTGELPKVEGEATYTAKFTNDTIYVVTFIDGDTTKEVRYNVTDNPEITVAEYTPDDVTGKIFDGWYTDEALTTKYVFGAVPSADVTLYAKWVADVNDNNVLDENETITITVNKANEADAVVITGAIETEDGYVYDSSENGDPTVTIVATPVVTDGISSTYVAGVSGVEDTGSYDASYVYTYSFTAENKQDVTVTFADAKLVTIDGAVMKYYPGMTIPSTEELYNTFVSAPDYAGATKVTVQYKAREAMTAEVDLSTLTSNTVLLAALKAINGGSSVITIDMPELWLDFDAELSDEIKNAVSLKDAAAMYLNEDAIAALWDTFKANGSDAVKAELEAIYTKIKNAAMYDGAHEFGYNATTSETVNEIVKITYKSDAMYLEEIITITLKDIRAVSVITGSNVSVMYKDYTDEVLLAAIGAKLTDEAGNAIEGTIYAPSITDPYTYEGLSVSDTAYELTFKFNGNETYKPSEGTFTVTITKAPINTFDVPNVIVTYGESYNMAPTVELGNAYGETSDVTDSMIQFVIGLDVADADLNSDGITGLNTHVQLMLPAELQEMLDKLTGTESAGKSMTLSELKTYLDLLDDGSVALLSQAIEAIENVTETSEITITVGGALPTDTGAYLYGAVTTNSNYETAMDVAYIIIKPAAERVYLDWNYTDTNGIFTHELLKYVDLGTSAYSDEALTAKNDEATALVNNLYFGIDANGELVASMTGTDLGNGAYTQLAFIADFGNEMYYAEPIVRAFIIVPNTADIQFVGDTGDNNQILRTFDNDEQVVDVVITVAGNTVTPAEGELTITYTGIQTNTVEYPASSVAPTHAGAYLVTVIYIGRDAAGEIIAVGADAAVMVIKPAEATIEVTGGTYEYDGDAYAATVVTGSAADENLKPDATVISGYVGMDGNIAEVGVDAIIGNANIDVPAWLDAYLAETEFATEDVDAAYLIDFITSYRDDLVAMIPVDEFVALGVEEAKIDAAIDELNAYIDELLAVLAKLPENVTLSFNDDVTYTEPGVYVYYGMVTDSDHMPAADTGLLVIELSEKLVVDIKDTTVTYNGEGQMPTYTADVEGTAVDTDMVYVIVDENKSVNLILEDDAQAILDLIVKQLGMTATPETMTLGQIKTALNEMYNDVKAKASESTIVGALVSALGVTEDDVDNIVADVKTVVVDKLVELGFTSETVVTINGEKPVDAGTYQVYGLAIAENYAPEATEGTLVIEPVEIVITMGEDTKVYGGADALTYTITVDGVKDEDGVVDGLTVTTGRAEDNEGEDVGTYVTTAAAAHTDSKNYNVTVEDGTLEITKKAASVTVGNLTITEGDEVDLTKVEVTTEGFLTDDVINVELACNGNDGDAITATVTGDKVGNYDITVNNGTLTVKEAEETVQYSFGQTVQIRVIEPWGLKANARVYVAGSGESYVDYDALYDYGVYFIRESDLDTAGLTQATITVEDILNDTDAVKYSKGDSHISVATIDGNKALSTIYDDGLYTYEFSDSVFVMYYVIDKEGSEIQYAPIRERNISELVNTRKDDSANFPAKERAVYAYMAQLEVDVLAYRAQFENPSDDILNNAPTIAESTLGEPAVESAYSFGHTVQIRVIEPWGLKFNARIYTANESPTIDYSALEDYGVVVWYDADGTYTGTEMTVEELLAKSDAKVYSGSNGYAFVEQLNGTNYSVITACYEEGIYTYQLDTNAYVMFFVKDNGSYYYGPVKTRNVHELLESRVDTATDAEAAVYSDMVNLYDAVTEYRKDFF